MSFKDDARLLVTKTAAEAAAWLAEKQADTDFGRVLGTGALGALGGGLAGGLYSAVADDPEDENYSPASKILGGAALGGLGGAGLDYMAQQPSKGGGDPAAVDPKPDTSPKTRQQAHDAGVTSLTRLVAGSALAPVTDPIAAGGATYGGILATEQGRRLVQSLAGVDPEQQRKAIQTWLTDNQVKGGPSPLEFGAGTGMKPEEAKLFANYIGGHDNAVRRPDGSVHDPNVPDVGVNAGAMKNTMDLAQQKIKPYKYGKGVRVGMPMLAAFATALGQARQGANAEQAFLDQQSAAPPKPAQ